MPQLYHSSTMTQSHSGNSNNRYLSGRPTSAGLVPAPGISQHLTSVVNANTAIAAAVAADTTVVATGAMQHPADNEQHFMFYVSFRNGKKRGGQ
mmetsp:Transcript_23610/g.43881  ORF Transcript_23610/g.43881 Transcript_23610/m.43881 type:complete len:94 (-) Transcript_23610:2430-2711(-)